MPDTPPRSRRGRNRPLPLTLAVLPALLLALAPAIRAQAPADASRVVPAEAGPAPGEPGRVEDEPPGAAEAAADEAEAQAGLGGRVWEAAWESVRGQRIVLGAAYEQGTLKFFNFRDDASETPTLTDNGRFVALFQYETEEQYFARYELLIGQAAFGYNLTGSYASLQVDRQLLHSAFEGDDVGTSVEGDYLVAAPAAFVRLGPLYPERAVFWKFAVGLGLGLVRFDGTVLRHPLEPTGPPVRVGTEGTALATVITVGWELQVERWLLAFRSLYLRGPAGGDFYTYELYSLGLAYGFRF